MRTLSFKDTLFTGITLFSMFFGAGNLIFPSFVGAQAGTSTVIAMAGLMISAVGLPILGVVAVAQSGGLKILAGRVHPVFASVFTILIYLAIGPGLAIPRTASTSYEMAAAPLIGAASPTWTRVGYSLVFFGVALLLSLRPEKLTDRLGKITGPCLLVLIGAMTVACLFFAPDSFAQAVPPYAEQPFAEGFLYGYLTMDTIAALNFGIIIALNIQAKGIEGKEDVVQMTVRSGWIAGAFLIAVYAALAYIGAVSGADFPGSADGTQALTSITSHLFGPAGLGVLGLVFVLACLNTCVGLLCCCSEYFSSICPKLSYRAWLILFASISFLISILGLEAILKISVPILGAIYPVAIILIFLGLSHRFCPGRYGIYPAAVACTAVVSIVTALDTAGIIIPGLTSLISRFPLYAQQLAWLLPAALGILVGFLIPYRPPLDADL